MHVATQREQSGKEFRRNEGLSKERAKLTHELEELNRRSLQDDIKVLDSTNGECQRGLQEKIKLLEACQVGHTRAQAGIETTVAEVNGKLNVMFARYKQIGLNVTLETANPEAAVDVAAAGGAVIPEDTTAAAASNAAQAAPVVSPMANLISRIPIIQLEGAAAGLPEAYVDAAAAAEAAAAAGKEGAAEGEAATPAASTEETDDEIGSGNPSYIRQLVQHMEDLQVTKEKNKNTFAGEKGKMSQEIKEVCTPTYKQFDVMGGLCVGLRTAYSECQSTLTAAKALSQGAAATPALAAAGEA